MKVLAPIVESVLSPLTEAIQPSQLEKAVNLISEHPHVKWLEGTENVYGHKNAILRIVGRSDPTVEVDAEGWPVDPKAVVRGKYASWILGQWVTMVQKLKTADWVANNPAAALEQGIIGLNPDEFDGITDEELEAKAQDRASQIRINSKHDYNIHVGRSVALRRALAAHDKIVKLGRAEKLNVSPDINSYKDAAAVILYIDYDPETIHSKKAIRKGKADPLKVPGSEKIGETKKFVAYEIKTAEAAMFHGARTKWCFKDESNAASYTSRGPLYVIYLKDPYQKDEHHTSTTPSTQPGFHQYLAISPYSNNVDTVEDYSGDDLWEIRTADNAWYDRLEMVRVFGLMDVLRWISVESDDGAVGFEPWTENGSYRKQDLGIEDVQVSHEGSVFMGTFHYRLEDVDDDGDINVTERVPLDSIVTKANLRAITPEPLRTESGSVYVNVRNDYGEWDDVYSVMRGQLLDNAIEDYYEYLQVKKEEVWESEYRETFREDLIGTVYGAEEDGIVEFDDYRIPFDKIIDAIHQATDQELDSLSQDANMEWHEPDVNLDDDPEPDTGSAAENLDIQQILDEVGFDYYEFEIPEEDEEEDEEEEDEEPVEESRRVLRRIMTGAAR